MLRIGIDTGGTFTDLVARDGSRRWTHKLSSTPGDPSQAVLQGLAEILAMDPGGPPPGGVIHGTTVATNALLEGKGARVALLTNAGFEDVLEIGRQNRPALYDAGIQPPEPLVPAALRFGITGRLGPGGREETPLDLAGLEAAVLAGLASGVTRFAVCFLHSYASAAHEEAAGAAVVRLGGEATLSSRVLPEYREYERTSTTVISATLSPVMQQYLARVESGLQGAPLAVFRSNGGILAAAAAGEEAVQTLLSGPAAGVIGAWKWAKAAGLDRIITFDMGGTSTDVALCAGGPGFTTETVIGGHPVRLPMLDIHTVGAGGGSLARADSSGALVVGPQSAGADPGPACYGRGEEPTVTDAHLVLGRLPPECFLDGRMTLDRQRAEAAVDRLALSLGLQREAAAAGIIRVAGASMERALRVVSVERGQDPRDFVLFSFGGAGGLHAAGLAASLGMREVVIPGDAGVFSAAGMLEADILRDASCAVLAPLGQLNRERRDALAAPLAARLLDAMTAEGVDPGRVRLERSLDLRYLGQSFELSVEEGEDPAAAFHALHQSLYEHQRPATAVEVVALRLRARARVPGQDEGARASSGKSATPSPAAAAAGPEPYDQRPVWFEDGARMTPFHRRAALPVGAGLAGPAVVSEAGATTLVPPGWRLRVEEGGGLRLSQEAAP